MYQFTAEIKAALVSYLFPIFASLFFQFWKQTNKSWRGQGLGCTERGKALDKILSNWVFWAIFTHSFLIELGIRIFLLGILFY